MKQLTRLTASLGVLALLASLRLSSATELDMYGEFAYRISGINRYYAYGAAQSGRYSNLGGGNYRQGNMSVATVENTTDGGRSGSLSLEFWAMPYYGASRGFVKFTRTLGQLNGGYYYSDIFRSGFMKTYGARRFPEFELFEYTRAGWSFKTDLLFDNSGGL